jgi:hypothetical protein
MFNVSELDCLFNEVAMPANVVTTVFKSLSIIVQPNAFKFAFYSIFNFTFSRELEYRPRVKNSSTLASPEQKR